MNERMDSQGFKGKIKKCQVGLWHLGGLTKDMKHIFFTSRPQ